MIIACVRTLNEELHIERFCRYYSEIADRIIVSDGGSFDRTLAIASRFPKVTFAPYPWIIVSDNGRVRRNPEGEHRNFVVKAAIEAGASWVVLDDCDSVPNKAARDGFYDVIKFADDNGYVVLNMRRIYMWGTTEWFPELSGGGRRAHG